MDREPLSAIVGAALRDITQGAFSGWSSMAVIGLMDDFQYAWLKRLDINYNFEVLEAARLLFSGYDKMVLKATQCSSIDDIRNEFTKYIAANHPDDDRIIISLSFDGKQIHAEWVEKSQYSSANKA